MVRPFEFAEAISGDAIKPRVRVKAGSAPRISNEPIVRVMAIGDPHDAPGRDKRRFKWLGKHAAKTNPDHIVVIGDTLCLDSLSTHAPAGSADDIAKPSFWQELDSLDEAISIFHKELPVGSIPITHTNGNHENRANRAAANSPKTCGDMPFRLEEVFARYRWRTYDFGEYVKIAGCDFVHCPLDVRRREVSSEPALKARSVRTLIMGHTHVNGFLPAVKWGQDVRVDILNLGTSMPWKERAHYVGTAPAPWGYGWYDLRIQDGRILSAKHYDMLEGEELYA